MKKKLQYILITIFLCPILLLSQNIETAPKNTIKVLEKEIENKKNNQNINLSTLRKKETELNQKKELTQEEKEIIKQNKLLEEVIQNINNESYLNTKEKQSTYKKELNLLANKININKRANNNLAVKRDEVKTILIKEKMLYEKTLRDIIIAKQEFKDKDYIKNLIENSIKILKKSKLNQYEKEYKVESKINNSISSEFSTTFTKLYNQNYTQIFILNHLLQNISKYRPTNFFIDEFNIEYLIKKIDSMNGISFISKVTSYYLKFTIGEILVVLFILAFFRIIRKYVISFISNVIAKFFTKKIINEDGEEEIIGTSIKKSINTPLNYALYTLGIHLSVLILIKDEELVNKLIPWINTAYIAIFTWTIYAVINNSITIYAHTLLEKYPNVRKEMLVFILRIVKIILILVVILFLLTQLGIDIKAIAASLGVGGIAVALASKDTLANFFGSLNIMTDNSFSQGDWIKTNDVEGTVVDIRMRTTRIRTFDNGMITIPNSQLANAHILNWSKRKIGRRIKMSLGITYESKMSDIKNLKDDIFEMLKNHPDIATAYNINIKRSKSFEIAKKEDLFGIKNTLLVYIDEFADSSINILIYCFSKSPEWEKWLITKEDVIMQISELVDKNNCEIAYPTQAITLKSPTEVATMEDKTVKTV